MNVRVFTANTPSSTYNYSPTNITTQDPTRPAPRLIQVGSFAGEPVDAGLKAAYQDEFTLGVEKALDPTLSVGVKGTYRTLGRTVEDRCDLDYNDPAGSVRLLRHLQPGRQRPGVANGAHRDLRHAPRTRPIPTRVVRSSGRSRRRREAHLPGHRAHGAQAFSQVLWAQASYLYSTLRGNYSGAIREASGQTDPGINADYDYNQFRPTRTATSSSTGRTSSASTRCTPRRSASSVGLQAYVRSGVPTSQPRLLQPASTRTSLL